MKLSDFVQCANAALPIPGRNDALLVQTGQTVQDNLSFFRFNTFSVGFPGDLCIDCGVESSFNLGSSFWIPFGLPKERGKFIGQSFNRRAFGHCLVILRLFECLLRGFHLLLCLAILGRGFLGGFGWSFGCGGGLICADHSGEKEERNEIFHYYKGSDCGPCAASAFHPKDGSKKAKAEPLKRSRLSCTIGAHALPNPAPPRPARTCHALPNPAIPALPCQTGPDHAVPRPAKLCLAKPKRRRAYPKQGEDVNAG